MRGAAAGGLVLALCLGGCRSALREGEIAPPAEDGLVRDALKAACLRPEDLSIKGTYLDDPHRLAVTKRLLENPLLAGRFCEEALARLERSPWPELLPFSAELSDAGRVPPRDRSVAVPDLPEGPVRELSRALFVSAERVLHLRRSWTEPQADRIARLFDLARRDRNVREREAGVLLTAGREVDRGALVRAGARAARAVYAFLEGDRRLPPAGSYPTPYGPVVIGTTGADAFDGPALLIVDPGGGDRYRDAAAAGEGVPVSSVIDLGGDDRYEGRCAFGRGGIGLLVDTAGDDVYRGGDGTQGAGVAGVGMLVDEQGDDRYAGGLGVQGFGLFGAGVLYDGGGNDTYEAALLAQGAAGPEGAGVLWDRRGDDAYAAGGPYRDFREGGAFAQSMAQGYGWGIRPLASGGIGLLCDGAGEDRYRVEYFGQGAGYWAGTGVAVDGGGNDVREARRYGQGAGVHFAVGVLWDAAGSDVYSIWGVGQGCGHDLALGLLREGAGDDRYEAGWLAQGAGSANGVGMLDDGAGADAYRAGRHDVRGYGVGHRSFGSPGLFVDRGGEDRYEGPGGNGRLWTGGVYGAGYDAGGSVP